MSCALCGLLYCGDWNSQIVTVAGIHAAGTSGGREIAEMWTWVREKPERVKEKIEEEEGIRTT